MRIKFFDTDLSDNEIKNRLIENCFKNSFSIKQKIYYNLIRLFIQVSIRRKIQEKVSARVSWKKDFIDGSLVTEITGLSTKKDNREDERNNYVKDIKFNLTKFRYENAKECAIVLTDDVEEESGFRFIPKVIILEEKYGFKSS